LISKIISSSYLHPEIREKGGAYGSGSSIGLNGLFSFTSFRDPNVTSMNQKLNFFNIYFKILWMFSINPLIGC